MVWLGISWCGMVWASCVAPTAGDDGGSTPAPPTAPNTPQEQTSRQTQSQILPPNIATEYCHQILPPTAPNTPQEQTSRQT